MGRKTKIDWCDSSWNPITGCLHGCPYCYAAGMARRFGGKIITGHDHLYILDAPIRREDGTINPYPYRFDPTYHKYRLKIPQDWKKPQTIFVCSMADMFGDWVPDEWIDQILTACLAAPQHRYMFLTKNPKRYTRAALKNILVAEDNFWYGTSTPRADDPAFWSRPSQEGRYYHTFLSIEPILERFGKSSAHGSVALTDWVIVGAETGNRKDKVIPEKGWIMELAEECDKRKKPIFMKESLRALMGEDFRQEFPWK